MTANIKFYLLTAFFVVVLVLGGVVMFNQHKKIQAQDAAFEIFKKQRDAELVEIFQNIDSLKQTDQAQDIIIDAAQGDRDRYQKDLNDLKNRYEKVNFNNYPNDSLAGYFAKRRRQR